MKIPPLRALHVFVTVVRSGGVMLAAGKLSITQSAVSHQLKVLEGWLGEPLFDRKKRALKLTEKGRRYHHEISPAFTLIAEATNRVFDRTADQMVVISALPLFANNWLIPRLNGFRKAYPNIAVQVVYDHPAHLGEIGTADLTVRYGRGSWDGFESMKLLDGDVCPVCSPDFLQEHGPFAAPGDLLGLELVHDETSQTWRTWFESSGVALEAPLKGPVFEDANMTRAAAIAGAGIGLCRMALIQSDLDEGRLVQLFDISAEHDKGYFLCWPKSQDLHAAAQHFKAWITNDFERGPDVAH